MVQPPSGGCVLKLAIFFLLSTLKKQPPSGGCVLKPQQDRIWWYFAQAATFGWLCVETLALWYAIANAKAATFGWLCVETFRLLYSYWLATQPPPRGCVLKLWWLVAVIIWVLAAASARLCVETSWNPNSPYRQHSSHLLATVYLSKDEIRQTTMSVNR